MNLDMLDYAIRRLIIGVFIVLCVTILLFSIMQLMPGDPIKLISNPRVPPERIAMLRQRWGLDKPAYIQYFYWLKNILRGDFGNSIRSGQEVAVLIKTRLPYTLMLAIWAMALEYIIAVPLGLLAAIKKDTALDRSLIITNIILWSMPSFWLGVILIIIFGVFLKMLPISGYSDYRSLILPVVTMFLPDVAMSFGLIRSEVIEAINQRFVLTAYAKGLDKKRVMIFHVLRNSLIPITVLFFLSLPWLIGGSVIIENIFGWPGMGRLLWTAISAQDFPIVQGVVLIITMMAVVSNIIGDIFSAMLDPRIRLE